MIAFDIFTNFISSPSATSIIGILSFISAIVALYIAWKAYALQKKSDADLKRIEDDIDKIENSIEKLSKTASDMQDNVNKTHFQIERTIAFDKYSKLESVNVVYLSFIRPLFDKEFANINIKIKTDLELKYEIQFIKNNANIPIKKEVFDSDYYIIKVISPPNMEVHRSGFSETYKRSPIKEGEYYICRFNDCMWFLEQTPKNYQSEYSDEESYSFSIDSSYSKQTETNFSANQAMGDCPKDYELICESTINNDIFLNQKSNPFSDTDKTFKLFKKENSFFFNIEDSPLKKIYTIKTRNQDQRKKFLIFENLRGHIKNENFIENLKNHILKKVNRNDIPEKTMDFYNFEKNYHIKIELENS